MVAAIEIEKLLKFPEICQLRFLDNSILRGRVVQLLHASTIMTIELAKIDFASVIKNAKTCCPSNAPLPTGFDNIPIVRDRDGWSYFGSPLAEQTAAALKSVLIRINQVTSKVAVFARTHPKQAFRLLRATAGVHKP